LSRTAIVAPCPIATIAHASIETVALPVSEMLFGTRCVTPLPAQTSLATTLAGWVTTVPFGCPQAAVGAVTVTVAVPLLPGSAVLVAVMAYVPGVVAENIAVLPLGVSVPPAGVTLQITPVAQDALALTVAASVAFPPLLIVPGLAATVTPETVQVGALLGLAPQPAHKSPVTVATTSARFSVMEAFLREGRSRGRDHAWLHDEIKYEAGQAPACRGSGCRVERGPREMVRGLAGVETDPATRSGPAIAQLTECSKMRRRSMGLSGPSVRVRNRPALAAKNGPGGDRTHDLGLERSLPSVGPTLILSKIQRRWLEYTSRHEIGIRVPMACLRL
jgi:hypothetical protein